MMEKRTPSATENFRNNVPKVFQNILNIKRIELDEEKKVYGVGLHPNIAQKRLKNTPAGMNNELSIFMVCPLGTSHAKARLELQNQINTWNVNHLLLKKQVWLNTSDRETDGEQARFSLPIKDANISIARIKFIVWLDKNTQKIAKVMLLGDVPYHQSNKIFRIIEKEQNNIEESLTNLSGCKLQLILNHHLDHYVGSHDSDYTNIS